MIECTRKQREIDFRELHQLYMMFDTISFNNDLPLELSSKLKLEIQGRTEELLEKYGEFI